MTKFIEYAHRSGRKILDGPDPQFARAAQNDPTVKAYRSFANLAEGLVSRCGARWLVGLLCLAWITFSTAAVTTVVDPGTPGEILISKDFNVTELTGLSLAGQAVALDVSFSGGEFIRTWDPSTFLQLTVFTSLPGFTDPPLADGFLVDRNGGPVSVPNGFGRGTGFDGSFNVGFFFVGLTLPQDFSGVHFALTMPVDASRTITSAKLSIGDNNPDDTNPVIVSPVPEGGGSVAIALVSFGFLGATTKLWPKVAEKK